MYKRQNFNYVWGLNAEIRAAKGAQSTDSKGKGKGKGKGKAYGKRSWQQMSDDERWWLQEFEDGTLKRQKVAAEAKCRPVQADYFQVEEEDR